MNKLTASPLYHKILKVFTDKHPNQFAFKRECPHIKRFQAICEKQEDPEGFAFAYLNTFWHLTQSKVDKPTSGQPFLPSILMSGGIWPRVEKHLGKQSTPATDEYIREKMGRKQ